MLVSMRISALTLGISSFVFLLGCGSDDSGGSPGSGGQGTGGSNTGGSGNSGTGGSGTGGDGGTSTGGSGGSSTGGSGGGSCTDVCAAANGIEWDCKKRFLYGVNYAWDVFSGDFGGISEWGQAGVAANAAKHDANLKKMRANGSSVIRWWMFPDFRGDGVTLDGSETPTGLGGTAVADIAKALELADAADVYVMLTLFSFDNFAPSEDVSGIWTPGLSNIVRDDAKRAALLDKVVKPVAQAVKQSPYAKRMIAWDVINEPEWAMTGTDPYGDPAFESNPGIDPVTFPEMETFLKETIVVLRAESDALVSVGSAAVKWKNAWSTLDQDFYQFHIYDWVNDYWPYDTPATDYGLDKPIVMGEMPMGSLSGVPYGTVLAGFWDKGYAGAMSWQFNEAGDPDLALVKAFADTHACETSYSGAAAYVTHSYSSAEARTSQRRCGVENGRAFCLPSR
jgi:hypothetical protein